MNLMNAVVHDSLLWVVPEGCEGIVDDHDRRHAAFSFKPATPKLDDDTHLPRPVLSV
jgi:hypothetical protein